MIPAANSYNIDRLRASADIIEEVNGLETYLGFCTPGTIAEDAPTWSILKIEASAEDYPIITRFKWAGGFCLYNLKWSERLTYEYTYKKF